MDSDPRDRRNGPLLCASWHEPLRKRDCWSPVRISTVCRSMEHPAHALADGDFVLQHTQISPVTRLLADDTRPLAHSAWIIGSRPGSARAESRSPGIWPCPAVLLRPASISAERHRQIGHNSFSPAKLSGNRDRRGGAETGRLWPRPAIHLCHVDSRRGYSLLAVPMVYGVSQPASGLDLAELSVKMRACRKSAHLKKNRRPYGRLFNIGCNENT